MKGTQFKNTIKKVGLKDQGQAARFLGISHRQVQRIAAGEYDLDRGHSLLLLTMDHWDLKPRHIDALWKEGP